MKKALLGIVVISIIAVITAPFINGVMMEKTLHRQLDKYNELYAELSFYPKYEITRYARQFGSSEIEWTITMPHLSSDDRIDKIILIEKAEHGYLGVSSTISLNKNSWYTNFINEQLNGQDPLTISAHYNVLSGVTAAISWDSFELQADTNAAVIVTPGTCIIKTDRALNNILIDAKMDGFSVPDMIDIQGVALHSNMTLISSLIAVGTSSLSIEQVDVKNRRKNKSASISAINVGSTVDFDEAHNTLSMHSEYSVDHIASDKQKIDAILIKIGIKKLDAEGLAKVYKVYLDLMNEVFAKLETEQADAAQMQAEMEQLGHRAGIRLMSEVEKLLKKDLEFEISKLHLTLPEGDIQGDFNLGLKQDITLANLMALTQQPEKLVEVFSFASNMTLPDGLVPNQEKLLMPMLPGMQGGMFEMLGDKLVHRAQIADNKLLLNDREVLLR